MSKYSNKTLEDLVVIKASTESSIIACTGLLLMSCISIYFGARSSIWSVQERSSRYKLGNLRTRRDALEFAFVINCYQMGVYLFPEVFFFISFILKLFIIIDMLFVLVLFLLPFVSKFRQVIVIGGVVGCVCSICLVFNPWVLSNIFGISVAMKYITHDHTNSVKTACTFLGLMAICDVLWVFATNVMSTIANSIIKPVELVFPTNIHYSWKNGSMFMKLGIGDVIWPGCFLALLLRFDERLRRGERLYFHSGIVAYVIGLVVTFVMTFTFKQAQPALLYLVPACIGIPCLVAVIKGDIDALLAFQDYNFHFWW